MIAKPGDEVVCIKDNWGRSSIGTLPPPEAPKKDETYTVIEIIRKPHGTYYKLKDCGKNDWWWCAFKPVVKTKTDITIFQEMDRKIFNKVKA